LISRVAISIRFAFAELFVKLANHEETITTLEGISTGVFFNCHNGIYLSIFSR